MVRSGETTQAEHEDVIFDCGLLITFSEEEILALRRALGHYLESCRQEGKKNSEERDFFIGIRPVIERIGAELKSRPRLPRRFDFMHHEMSTLNAALTSYLKVCEQKIAHGVTLPFRAERAIIKAILARIPEEYIRGAMQVHAELAARRNVRR